MRSDMLMASAWSWVTYTAVMPTARWILRISVRIWTRSLASRLDSGSSKSSTPGSMTRARARATRCCCPPESSLVWRLSSPSSPVMARIPITFSRISCRDSFLIFRP